MTCLANIQLATGGDERLAKRAVERFAEDRHITRYWETDPDKGIEMFAKLPQHTQVRYVSEASRWQRSRECKGRAPKGAN